MTQGWYKKLIDQAQKFLFGLYTPPARRLTTSRRRRARCAFSGCESLEYRLLLSGSPVAAEVRPLTPSPTQQHEIVFVDTSVSGYRQILADLSRDPTRDVETVLIDSSRDGVEQISQALAGQHDIDAIDIISHGADGALELGSTILDSRDLLANAAAIGGWGKALAANADILLYGCNVAQHADGQSFVDALSHLTGANVAASTNLTGSADLGGDWNLEYRDGVIHTDPLFGTSGPQNWEGVLSFVEQTNTWAPTVAGSWQTKDLGAAYGVPANAVVEIAISNSDSGSAQTGGVRAVGSVLNRSFSINKEQQGTESLEMLVQANASGQIQTFASSTSKINYTILGYWTSGTYVETSGSFTASTAATWQAHSLSGFGVGANQVAEIVITNNDNNNSPQVGVRTSGSSLNRLINVRSMDGGAGPETVTMLAETGGTAAANIEAYAQLTANVTFNVVGYWSTAPGNYTETFANIGAPSTNSTWQSTNLSTYGVTANSVANIIFTNQQTNTTNSAGVRAVGSSNSRVLALNSFSSGANGGPDNAGMFVQATNDANATVQYYDSNITNANFYLLGYFAGNSAPVLSGANNLTAINEDPGSNPGTLVSALISGQVTDAGALTGIAVTAVDNTNGTWQYSTNSGGAWTAFGTPSATTARLLAADANTYVRFVPNANWNGTVSTGITFRAWDQTTVHGRQHCRCQHQWGRNGI